MRSWIQRRRVVAALLAAGMALGGSARAQGAGPLTLVVPAPAGSDWPYAPKQRSLHFTRLLEDFELEPAVRQAMEQGNARRLFPRLA